MADIPYGFCRCGCGQKTRIAVKDDKRRRHVKGEPLRCLPGHIEHRRDHRVWINPSNTSTYVSWCRMLARTSPDHEKSRFYSERGITVCERWKNYDAFVEDMGLRPDGMTIDRKDGSKSYEPNNCRWATKAEQASNMRSNQRVTVNGETHTYADWERKMGLGRGCIWARINLGWSQERAVLAPKLGSV